MLLRKAFFPSAYVRPRREISLEKHLLCMHSLQNLYRLQRKNMRKNKLNIVQLCQAENRALHCSIFQKQVNKHLKRACLGWRKIKRLTELIKPSNRRKLHWNTPSSYWDILIHPYYIGRSENALFTFFYPMESFSKTASLWAHDVILTLLQRLYHIVTSYRRCNNVKITSCARRLWYHCGF